MNRVLAALLAFILLLMGSRVEAAELIRMCSFNGGARVLNVWIGEKDSYPSPPTDLVVVAPKGRDPVVRVSCQAIYPAVKASLGIPANTSMNLEEVITGVTGRAVSYGKGTSTEWFVPVRTGVNEIQVSFRSQPYWHNGVQQPARETQRETVRFQAWVVAADEWGRLDRAGAAGDLKEPYLAPKFFDPQGNLLAVVSGKRGDKNFQGLVLFAPGGRVKLRYQIGERDGYAEGWPFIDLSGPIGFDASGNLYVNMRSNVVKFDPAGKYAGTLGSLPQYAPINSAADFDREPDYNAPRKPLADLNGLHSGDAADVATIDGVFYLLGTRKVGGDQYGSGGKTHWVVVRLATDGKVETFPIPVAEDQKYTFARSITVGPNRTLWLVVEGKANATLVYDLQGKLQREITDFSALGPGRSLYEIKYIDPDGRIYLSDCYRVSADFKMRAESPQRVSNFYASAAQLNTPIDVLTGQAPKGGDTNTRGCLVQGGTVFFFYDDLRLARFAPVDGGPAQPAQTARATALGPKLRLERTGARIDDAVTLGGQVIPIVAVVTDAAGKPLAGVPVEISVDDSGLPLKGRFAHEGDRLSDAQGRVTGLYFTPVVPPEKMGPRMATIGMHALARPPGATANIEASATAIARAAVLLRARLSRAGYAEVVDLPVPVPAVEGGEISGVVIQRIASAEAPASAPEFPTVGTQIELFGNGKTALGTTVTDADGKFVLAYGSGAKTKVLPKAAIEEPLAFIAYDPQTAALVRNAEGVFKTLAGEKYGYRTEALAALLRTEFPQRMAAAGSEEAARRVIDQLERIGLLAAALKVTHDLSAHAADQWADSLGAVVKGLMELLDPLGALVPGDKTRGAVAEGSRALVQGGYQKLVGATLGAADAEAALKAAVFGKIAYIIRVKIENKLADKATYDKGLEALFDKIKDFLHETLEEKTGNWGGDNAVLGWKSVATRGLISAYRDVAQAHLDAAAQVWKADTLPFGGQTGPLFRARYREIAEHKEQTAQRQLDKDYIKADVDFAFESVGQGIVYSVALLGSPQAGELAEKGQEAMKKGFTAINAAMDAYQGYLWLEDFMVGYKQTDEFARAALRSVSYCFGDGC